MPSVRVNASVQWLSYGINALIMLFLTPYVIGSLGKSGFGIWRFALTFVGYYGVLNLAVSSSITRYVARYAGGGDRESLNDLISTATAIYIFSAVMAIGLSFALGERLVLFFDKTPPGVIADFKHLIWILGVTTGFGFLSGLLGAIVTAHEHYVWIGLAGIGVNFVRAALTIIFLMKGMGLVGIAWANLIPVMIGMVINYLICGWLVPGVKVTVVHARWKVLRKLVIYSASTMVIMLGDMLRTQIDSTVIGKMIGFEEVAVFGIAGSLLSQVVSFTIAGVGVLTPRFANLEGGGRLDELRKLFVKALHYSALLGFGLCLLALIWGGNFIRLWVGEGFNRSIPIVWILAFAWMSDLSQSPGVGLMYAMNKHRFYAGACICEGSVKLVLTIFLVGKYGVIGAAVATALPMLALRLLVQPIYVARIAGLSLRQYSQPFLIPFVSVCLVGGACYSIGAFSNRLAGSWVSLAAYGVATSVVLSVISMQLARLLGLERVSINLPRGLMARG